MKFLVVAEPREGVQAPENYRELIQATIKWFETKLADGSIDCVYQTIDGGGLAIVNADSHEALWEQIMSYPLGLLVNFGAEPLIDIHFTFKKTLELMK